LFRYMYALDIHHTFSNIYFPNFTQPVTLNYLPFTLHPILYTLKQPSIYPEPGRAGKIGETSMLRNILFGPYALHPNA
jgi:hypothetical protein